MLKRIGSVNLPSHSTGDFDHADVHERSGKVYIAHTANGTVEVVDGGQQSHIKSISGCPEASGVLCAQSDGLVFAASRGEGRILVIDTDTDKVVREISTGPGPNGLAWDSLRRHLLVADVKDNQARLLDPASGETLSSFNLKGRPRWCLHDKQLDAFLVNIRDPAGVAIISPETMSEQKFVPVSVPGPHGLEAIEGAGRAFVACDGKALVVLDFLQEREVARIPLSGAPDVLWQNRKKSTIYCAIGDPGIIDVIDTEKLSVADRIPTEEGAHTLTFDEKRQLLYAFLPKSHCAAVYSEM